MSCEFGHDDGAYVLGALSPAERSEFHAHLAGCAECTRAVQELAGLPGLLARVPAEVLESPASEPPPETLLPTLVQAVRRTRRRRAWAVVGSAAAALVVVAGGSVVVANALRDEPPPSAVAPKGRDMAPVGTASMSANVALTSVKWGTRLDLSCSYRADEYADTGHEYAMFVRTREGRLEQVATWRALPGRTMRLTAATAASRDDIASVEIRTASGRPVLHLNA